MLVCNNFQLYHRNQSYLRYQLTQNSVVDVFLKIARSELLPGLETLCCSQDIGGLASYQLTPDERIPVRELYEQLVSLSQRDQLKSNLKIYIQDLRFQANRPYDDCGYQLKLLKFHANNLLLGHEVQPTYLVAKVDYLDVMAAFFLDQAPVFSDANRSNPFFRLYPNLRIVAFNNRTRQTIPLPEILGFLGCCFGLVRLEMRSTNFGPDFYAQLPQLPSLAGLNSLVISEQPPSQADDPAFAHHIDFESLLSQFRYLQILQTNLVTWPALLRLVRWIQVNGHFEIDFSVDHDFYTRFKLTLNGDYELRINVQRFGEQFSVTKHREYFQELEDLEEHLRGINPALYAHWLDDDRVECTRLQLLHEFISEQQHLVAPSESNPDQVTKSQQIVDYILQQQQQLLYNPPKLGPEE